MTLKGFIRLKKGFTLIELLIVIVIIIVLTGIAIPVSVNYINERQVYNAATQIQQDLLLVQNLAITHSSDSTSGRFEIYFYPSDNKYYVETTEKPNEDAEFDPVTKTIKYEKVITRQFSSTLGFPKFFEKDTPPSVKLYDKNGVVKSVPLENYIAISFNNFGEPTLYCHSDDNDSGIIIANSSLSKVIKVEVTQIGRVKIDWITK
jgi:prepilin-type N-terminal cleavage/methylation domain-containing protein